MTTVEQCALDLVDLGINDEIDCATKEADMSDDDWQAALGLAGRVQEWIRDNPETLLTLVRGEAR